METDQTGEVTEFTAIPYRWWEIAISANTIGRAAAAALAMKSPGMLGVVKFMAARGDDYEQVCEALGLERGELEAILQEHEQERLEAR